MDGRRVVVSMDEAPSYLLHKSFRDQFEDLLATARKQEGIIIICAQQPESLLRGTFGVMMVNQCQTKIALPNNNADKKAYCDDMHFTPGEYFAVHEGMHPHSHEFLIQRPDGSAIIDFDLSTLPEYIKILSGRTQTVRAAEILREQHGAGWVDEFMKEAAE
jgi:type IV secretion system protein VirB4